jgi:hypothetical protein
MVNSKTLAQLPTLWCIKDCREVTAWAAKTFNCANNVSTNYLHVDMSRYPDRRCYSFEPKRYSDHTEISLEDFKRFVLTVESDGYSFPKNWAVKVTEENQSTLKEWAESRPDFDKAYVDRCNHLKEGYYVLSDRYDGSYQLWTEILDGFCHMFSEITFDQFKKHVLKQNQEPVMEKKLIGYILKNKEMYEAASIIAFKNVGGTYYWAEGRPDNRDTVITPLREAGVLDLWFEPVYEEIRVKPTVEFDNVDAHSKGLSEDGQWYLTVTFKMNNVDPKPKVKEMVQRWAKEVMVESLRNLVDSKS